MRLFVFLFLIFSFSAFAQLDVGNGGLGACLDTDPAFANGGTFECATLTLNGTPAFTDTATPLHIKVTGAVTISGVVNLNGSAGITQGSFTNSLGGDGGPGAGDGGGDDGGGTSRPGMNIDSTIPDPTTAAGGAAATGDPNCGDGGGGGGFKFVGLIGGACATGTGGFEPGTAGTIVPSGDFSFTGTFRGGVGGGAGGDSSNPQYGAGGGGGGAIRITAGGDITITAGGSLVANGGAGGNGGPDFGPGTGGGGGGGGGSGGVIWLQTLGNIIHDGSMTADGGLGGGANSGAPGGDGGDGFIRLEDIDGVITGIGTLPGYEEVISLTTVVTSSPTLKSDISCGMIRPVDEKDSSQIFQIMMGFLLVMAASFLINRLKFFSKTQI